MAEAAGFPARGVLDTVPGLRQLVMLAGVAGAIAFALWLVLWSQGPNYTVLYGQLSSRDATAVVEALKASAIEHKLDINSGVVMVPSDRLHDARLMLAAQGLPEGDGLGIEMLKQQDGFGTSQFMETARYQLALETELGRTVIRVQGVQTARVHLALPKASVFVRDRRRASASVMLQLFPGRRLDPGQVAAIVHLVASSVPDLEASQVTVIDQNGTLLSSPQDGDGLAATVRQLDYQRRVEQGFEERIEALLTPLVGIGRVRAGVTADLDFTQAERTSEDFDPAQQVVRSEQTSSDQRSAGDTAQGIPGALSNQPPQTSAAPPAAAQQGAVTAAVPAATQQRATRNYEIDRTISHVRTASGSVRRLSVAVILDNKPAADGAEGAGTAYATEEIERFTSLVREAIGFDEARGDRVQVLNAGFSAPAPAPAIEAIPFWQEPSTQALARQGLGAVLVILVAFFVLRPLMASVTRPMPAALLAAGLPDVAGDRVSIGQAGGRSANYEQQVAAARSLVGQDPRRAAEVVKDWVTTDGR